MVSVKKAEIITALQADILRLQGFKPAAHNSIDPGLGPIKNSFPNHTFPIGQIHEFLADGKENASASCGFIAGILASLMGNYGTLLWISSRRNVFPPGLKMYGMQPDRCIFVALRNEKDILWVMDEALKCSSLTAVLSEIRELDFTESRRLQLAVEQSKVTGFILRTNFKKLNTTACVSRWRITSLPSAPIDELPGIGFPKWKVELLRIRNGKPSSWEVQWVNGKFVVAVPDTVHAVDGHGNHFSEFPLVAATGNP